MVIYDFRRLINIKICKVVHCFIFICQAAAAMLWCLLFLVSSLSLGPVFSQTGLSASEKQTILNEHNRLRELVSPTAANMQRMVGTNLHMPCEAMLVPYMVATE